ncbi:MAG: hypothetical protein Q7T82_18140 [Armatimonadota bacterium]|nr:hypothetical protein [Armatimonadota bacterium]
MSVETASENVAPAGQAYKARVGLGKIGNAGVLLLSLGIVLAVCYPAFFPKLVRLLQTYASADHSITEEGRRQLTDAVYFFAVLLMVVGSALVLARNSDRRLRLTQVFVGESARPSPRFVLLASSTVGLLMVIHIRLYDPSSPAFRILYKEDGVFELLTPLLMVASAILIGRAVLRLRKHATSALSGHVTAAYLVLMLFFVLYAGEEVTWGQRVFGWSTPGFLGGNSQNETNIHNYFNGCFPSVYRLPIILPFLVLFSAWLEFKKPKRAFTAQAAAESGSSLPYASGHAFRPEAGVAAFARASLPHPSTIGLACIIAFVSLVWNQEQELLEELVALFSLFYSLGIYGRLREPANL